MLCLCLAGLFVALAGWPQFAMRPVSELLRFLEILLASFPVVAETVATFVPGLAGRGM